MFLLRVVLHDWPDDFARKILLRLREAATPETKLLIADFVLPLACPDDTSSTGGLEGVEGAESVLAPGTVAPQSRKGECKWVLDGSHGTIFLPPPPPPSPSLLRLTYILRMANRCKLCSIRRSARCARWSR